MSVSKLRLQTRSKDTAFIKTISDTLVAAGFVITTDTGQMDPTSLPAYSSTVSNVYGYIIYKFNDTAQSTRPIFVKMSWQNGATANTVGIYPEIQIGSSTDGAGTLGGSITTAAATGVPTTLTDATTTADPGAHDCYVGGDGSSMILVMNADMTTPRYAFCLDRWRSSANVVQTTGWTAVFSSTVAGGTPVMKQSLNGAAITTPTQLYAFPGPAPVVSTMDPSGYIPIIPMLAMDPDIRYLAAMVGCIATDLPQGAFFTVTRLGASHKYVSLGAMLTAVGGSYAGASLSVGTIAVLYE